MNLRRNRKKLPLQTPLVRDKEPPLDLSRVQNDADDPSENGRPATDHEADGWRETPPVKP